MWPWQEVERTPLPQPSGLPRHRASPRHICGPHPLRPAPRAVPRHPRFSPLTHDQMPASGRLLATSGRRRPCYQESSPPTRAGVHTTLSRESTPPARTRRLPRHGATITHQQQLGAAPCLFPSRTERPRPLAVAGFEDYRSKWASVRGPAR